MHKAKVLGRKRVPHLMRPGVKGMARNASLHADRPDLLSKMLLGIADDLLGHCLSQGVVRFILDRDARHRDAPRKGVGYEQRESGVSVALMTFTLREECQRMRETDARH